MDSKYESYFSPLAQAIFSGDEEKIKTLLEMNIEDKRKLIDSETGKSVLHMAACSDHGFMEVFLDNDTIRELIDEADLKGITPLMEAVGCGNVSAVKLFLSMGAATRSIHYGSRRNVFHVAAAKNKPECLAELLKHDSSSGSLNALDDDGNTPLMLCSLDMRECGVMLLDAGADVEMRNPHTGRNVLHLAILDSNLHLIIAVLSKSCEQGLVNKLDSYGDTPLRLAMRTEEFIAARMLLSCPGAHELVWEFPEVVHYALAANDLDLIDQLLPLLEKEELMTWTDSQGKTALMVAVENCGSQVVKKLLDKGVRACSLRDLQGQSVLHKAVSSGDVEILALLLDDGQMERLVDIRDGQGLNPIETALVSGKFESFAVMWKSGLLPNKPLNSKLESSLFIAAKFNNYSSFLLLLLSTHCANIVSSLLNYEPITDVDLVRAYLQKKIYASDVYLMTGRREKNVNWNFCPSRSFEPTSIGRTIFHACALGGHVDVLSLYYKFCEIFYPGECSNIDLPDIHGTTPLLLACQCEHREVVRFLLEKGANLCKEDEYHETPLTAIYRSVNNNQKFMEELLSDCIVSDGWSLSEEAADAGALTVHFSLLCPEGELYARVTSEIFKTWQDFQDGDLLRHPLLRLYILHMLSNFQFFMKMRYLASVTSAVSFTIYLMCYYCALIPRNVILLLVLRWLSVVSFVLAGLWALPLSFLPNLSPMRWFEGKSLLVPSILGLFYFIALDGSGRTSLEVAAVSVMLSWMSLMSFSVSSPFRHQKAMFQVLFTSMYSYLPICFLVTCGFSFYFFVIFHNYFAFNNPFQSLLFSAFQLPRGDLGLIPVLTDETEPFRGDNAANFKITKVKMEPGDNTYIDTYQEVRAMLVEGSALILFLLISNTISNLLTALAVKSGEEVALSGDVYDLASQIDRLEKWQIFLSSKSFAFLRKCRLLWIMCIPRSALDGFAPPAQVHPLVERPKNFEVFMIGHHFTQKVKLPSNRRLVFFLEWFIHKDKRSYASEHSSFNKMFLEL